MPRSAHSHDVDLGRLGCVQLEREERVVADRKGRELSDVPDVRQRSPPRFRTSPVGHGGRARRGGIAPPAPRPRRRSSRSADRRGDLVDLGVRERAAVEERAAVADDRDHGRLSEPERLGELLLDRARGARQLGERKRAAADARDGLLDLAADERGEPLCARPNTTRPARGACAGREPRPSSRRASSASVPSSAASVSLSARSARCSGWRRSRSTRSPRPTMIARLRPAEQLVAGEGHEVGARAEALRRRRLVADRHEGARAEIVDRAEARGRGRPRRARRARAAPRTRRRGSSTGARGAGAPVSGPMARS